MTKESGAHATVSSLTLGLCSTLASFGLTAHSVKLLAAHNSSSRSRRERCEMQLLENAQTIVVLTASIPAVLILRKAKVFLTPDWSSPGEVADVTDVGDAFDVPAVPEPWP